MKKIILALFCFATLVSKEAYSEEYKCNDEGKNPTSAQINDVISCSFEQEQDTDVFVLASSDISRIKIRVSPLTGNCTGVTYFSPTIKVYNSSDELITKNNNTTNCFIGVVGFTTVENETYTVNISNWKQHDYTVELQCLSGSCISSSLVEGYTSKFEGQELNIPFVKVGDLSFWAKLKLISSSPLQFELEEAEQRN